MRTPRLTTQRIYFSRTDDIVLIQIKRTTYRAKSATSEYAMSPELS